MQPIKILITDDHALLRQTLVLFLNTDQRFKVIGECKSGEEAIETVKTLRPDIILMDVNLPGINGFEACQAIVRDNPLSKILGLSMNAEPVYASKMIRCGAMGYVTKNATGEELFVAVMTIHNNRKYVCKSVKDKLFASLAEKMAGTEKEDKLSLQEIEMIIHTKLGFTLKEIGDLFGFSTFTVDAHYALILQKLKLSAVESLVNYPDN